MEMMRCLHFLPWTAESLCDLRHRQKVMDDSQSHEIREGRFCKKCGALLQYHFYHYSQLGDYVCTGCDFRRPPLDFERENVEVGDTLAFTVGEEKIPCKL